MKIWQIVALELLAVFSALFVYDLRGEHLPAPVIQGTPYITPSFDFDVESGDVTSKVIICKPVASDTKHPDHVDRLVRLVCEDGRVVLRLNNVEFPDGFMLRVGPAY